MNIIGFDYDGTIINIEPEKARAFAQLLHNEWSVDPKESEKFWIATGGTSRRYKFDYFYNKQFSKELPDSNYQKIEKKFSQILKTSFYPQVDLLSGAFELLKFAREKFDYTFISSGVTHGEINYLVRLNGIENYFDDVYGTNEVYASKEDHFREILNNKNPQTKIFVGDGEEDMKLAKKFRFETIGIPTNHTEENLKAAGADYVVELKDCQALIEKLI